MDHFIGCTYPFSNSAFKKWPPHHHKILHIADFFLEEKVSDMLVRAQHICQGGVSQGFPPISKEVEEEEEKEEEEKKEGRKGKREWEMTGKLATP